MTTNFVVAEDNDLLRDTIAQLLESMDTLYTCVGRARNGAEAIELVGRHEPDLLILDLRMPIMDGYDVIRTLGEKPSKPYILVLTMESSTTAMQKALNLGAEGYCTKNAGRGALLEAVAQVSRGNRHTCPDLV